MKKIILVLAFLPTMLLAQVPKKQNPFKNVSYTVNLFSSNENNVKQHAVQFGVAVPTKNSNTIGFVITAQSVRQPNQKAQNDLSFNFSISGKSKK